MRSWVLSSILGLGLLLSGCATSTGTAGSTPASTPPSSGSGAASPAASAAKKPIVAVFTLQLRGFRLAPAIVNDLSDYLVVRLVETGRFKVIPRSEVKKRLKQQKRASYKSCYDQRCQIAIGRELAANKLLEARVMRLGSQCTLTGAIYDLRSATAEKAAHQRGACAAASVGAMIARVVAKLTGTAPPVHSATSAADDNTPTHDHGAPRTRPPRSISLRCDDCYVDDDSNKRWQRFKRKLDRAKRRANRVYRYRYYR